VKLSIPISAPIHFLPAASAPFLHSSYDSDRPPGLSGQEKPEETLCCPSLNPSFLFENIINIIKITATPKII
jgi:hypothetical protein